MKQKLTIVDRAVTARDGPAGKAAMSAMGCGMSCHALHLSLAGAFEDDGKRGVSGYVPTSHRLQGLQSDQVSVLLLYCRCCCRPVAVMSSGLSLCAAVGIELFMARDTETWGFVPFPG